MDSKIVGSKDCTFAAIGNILSKFVDCNIRSDLAKWEKLTKGLICKQKALEAVNRIQYQDFPVSDILAEVLEEWSRKTKNTATLDKLIRVLDTCQLSKAADKICKGFGCRPRKIDEKLKELDLVEFKYLQNEMKNHIFENAEGLAEETKVTPELLKQLISNDIIQTEEEKALETKDDESKSLSLYRIILTKSDFDLVFNNLIDALENDCQFSSSWILREFYDRVENIPGLSSKQDTKEASSSLFKRKVRNPLFISESSPEKRQRADSVCSRLSSNNTSSSIFPQLNSSFTGIPSPNYFDPTQDTEKEKFF